MNKFPELKNISHLLASFFGIGLLPIAPGTWGSLAALLLFFCFVYLQINFFLFLLFLCLICIFHSYLETASKNLIERSQGNCD